MTTHPTVLYHTPRASKTRQEILRTSMDIASAEGLEGLSIGRLATELNMSKTGIFAHFGSKEQLQLATVDAAKQVFLEQVVQPSRSQGVYPACVQCWRTGLDMLRGSYFEAVVFSPPPLPSSTVAPVRSATKSPALPRRG